MKPVIKANDECNCTHQCNESEITVEGLKQARNTVIKLKLKGLLRQT